MPTHQRRPGSGPAPRRPVKKYKPDVVRAAFSKQADFVGEETGDEQRLYCPLCENRATSASPSASMNFERGEWSCKKTDHIDTGEVPNGSIFALVDLLKRTQNFVLRAAAESIREPSVKKPTLPPPIENQDAVLDCEDELWGGRPQMLEYLRTQRGFTDETIKHFHIGAEHDRITLPIRVGIAGVVRNIKRYKIGGNPKWLSTPGHGSPSMLALTSELAGNTHPVILAAGEWDGVLTNQQMAGHAVAVTATGGEGTVPPDLSPLAGREVFVAYDCDDAGRAGAVKIATPVGKVGATVYVLDLTRLGLPSSESHGADLTDYWMRHGGTADKLLAEMERLRSAGDSMHDAVDVAMEAAFLELGSPRRDYAQWLLSEDDILGRPAVEYVIEPFIPRGMFTDAFGLPGSGKTFVGQDMFNCVRAGIPWHGHATTRGAVLMLEAEGVEQLQTRILAWREHHDYPDMAGFRALQEPLDLSSPQGAASLVRTVQFAEAVLGETIVLVMVDPAALYMAGGENEGGNLDLARGLNAVAKYLNCGVLLIAHTNAAGERARGTDHFRMLSGSHIRVERLETGYVGVVQEKVKNTEPRAVVLRPVPVGASLAFDTAERMTAAEYAAQKNRDDRKLRATERIVLSEAQAEAKGSKAEQMLLGVIATNPGIVRGKLLAACKSQGVGNDLLGVALTRLVEIGTVRVEATGTAPNSPHRHYIATEEPSEP